MFVTENNALRTIKTKKWSVLVVIVFVMMEVACLNGPNVCMVKQKYNITKRVKYRAPMSVRTYEWCFSMPPRCSRWNTEMRDLTRLETEERTAEVAVCCPGYKMQDVSCVPICPNGKTGQDCSEGCPINKWGPNCVHDCKNCSSHGSCSPITGECECRDGWQGESCQISMSTTVSTTTMREILTTLKTTTQNSSPATKIAIPSTTTVKPIIITSSQATSTIGSTARTDVTSPIVSTTEKHDTSVTIETTKAVVPLDSKTETSFITSSTSKSINKEVTNKHINNSYNRTEPTIKTAEIMSTTEVTKMKSHITQTQSEITLPSTSTVTTMAPKISTELTKETAYHSEGMKKPDMTIKIHPTTVKFKPKEIWIKPAQKGESTLIEIKSIQNHDTHHLKHKDHMKKELAIENTTPKTIIVSIIPTSVSYATFKKIALTTASYVAKKNLTVIKVYNQSLEGITKPMLVQTSTSRPTWKLSVLPNRTNSITTTSLQSQSFTSSPQGTFKSIRRIVSTKTAPINNKTNSMTSTPSVVRLNSSSALTTTTSSTYTSSTMPKPDTLFKKVINDTTSTISLEYKSSTEKETTKPYFTGKQNIEILQRNVTAAKGNGKVTGNLPKIKNAPIPNKSENTNATKLNVTTVSNSKTNNVTDVPNEDEGTFHILTEPEHITAVMGEKGTDRTSVDLVSVISIAGGVMMAIITIAVVIVMIERCKKPRYEDVRKINDIRMQVMIDNNDVPPPYVRSIFHTPLPEPPSSEKCHYQPISTLDRNLKQFMRPVVVQTISPIMLENFRGILECHYDHLPRRNHDFGTMPARFSAAPSINYRDELPNPRAHSVTDSTIEALKCEAKLDVIDTTTAEPLYAEIPCWRPPSEHAIEIVNLNGEAVTEL